jgi:hypothetical protein
MRFAACMMQHQPFENLEKNLAGTESVKSKITSAWNGKEPNSLGIFIKIAKKP